jgi:hypothetical protein
MTENAESSTATDTKTVRLIGQEAIEYAAAGHETRLVCVGKEGMSFFVPPMDDVDPEKAQDMVDNGTSPDLFSCEADPRIVALGRFLDDFSGIDEDRYGENHYDGPGRSSYFVLTDEEADIEAKHQVMETLWAFNVSFLSRYAPALGNSRASKAWEKMVGELCEDATPLVEAVVGDRLDEMVQDAIREDGRGHFLSSYDGEEREESVGGTTYYIYREN